MHMTEISTSILCIPAGMWGGWGSLAGEARENVFISASSHGGRGWGRGAAIFWRSHTVNEQMIEMIAVLGHDSAL